MTRGDLSDAEWELVEPHLPLGVSGPIPDLRSYFDATMWRFRTNSPWRDVPERYGSWSTIYDRFRMWARDGIFQGLMDAMIAEAASRGDVDLGLVSVDSTTARAHHDAAGMAVDSALLDDLAKAVTEEKGLRERRGTRTQPRTATRRPTPGGSGGGRNADGAKPG